MGQYWPFSVNKNYYYYFVLGHVGELKKTAPVSTVESRRAVLDSFS